MPSPIDAFDQAWLAWLPSPGAGRLRGGNGFCRQFMSGLTEPPATDSRAPWAEHLLAAIMRRQPLPDNGPGIGFSAWQSCLRAYLTGMLALPLWHQGLGEAEGLIELSLAARRPLTPRGLDHCLGKARCGDRLLPLFSDLDHLATQGSVLAAACRAETLFPTFTAAAGQDDRGQLICLTIEALRYETGRADTDLRGVSFPHVDTAFMPIADDFAAAFEAANALWVAHWPRDVALRWRLDLASTEAGFTANYLHGPSAGLAIAMATGKVLADLAGSHARAYRD